MGFNDKECIMTTNEKLTKEKVFEMLCKATRINTLGLFIGSGFTKAILENSAEYQAYTWKELLGRGCARLGLKKDILEQGMPYPQVASEICQEYSISRSVKIEDAIRKLKLQIADLVDVHLDRYTLEDYKQFFKTLDPNWIVTTNYDTIIEQILCEKAYSINPKDGYIKAKDFIPVYHIHGCKTDPDSIVITNDDYTHTLRISDYRHARLPFLIKESTVLMIGYSLNDLNVLSALDYCQNIYTNVTMAYEVPIIQLLYKKMPKIDPYWNQNQVIVQEIGSLTNYFKELSDYSKRYRSIIGRKTKTINELVEKYTNADDKSINNFIDNKVERATVINSFKDLDREFWYAFPCYIAFLNKGLSILWNKASEKNAFSYYGQILDLLLDLIQCFKCNSMPDNYVDFLIEQFKSVAYYIGDGVGKSWDAKHVWDTRKNNIPKDFIDLAKKRYQHNDSDSLYAKQLFEQIN